MMTRRTFQAGVLLFAASRGAAAADTLAGAWSGVLYAGARRLRLKLDIAEDGTASLVSLDQGGRPLPPGRVVLPGAGRIRSNSRR